MKKILEVLALSAALLLPLSGGIRARAEEIIETPKLEVIVNYEAETTLSPIDYVTSTNRYNRTTQEVFTRDSISQVTSIEEATGKVISDIQNNHITSDQEFLEASENLSESQKLILASVKSYLFYKFGYDISLLTNDAMSQGDSFSQFQDSLISGEDNSIGTCGHIAIHIARDLNNMDIRAAPVTGRSGNGIGHAYVIAKTENGTAIVDGPYLLIANTKNIEKVLEAYQKENGTTALLHLFFEDTEIQYRLIPRVGKRVLNSIEHDESSNPLKNSLLNIIQPQSHFTVTLNRGTYINSFETNLWGFFIKAGEIMGENSSPMQNISTIQAGFKRDFSLFDDKVIISPDLSFIEGNLIQDAELDDDTLQGIKGNLIVNTNRERGFNLTSRVGGALIYGSSLFYDLVLGTGASYTAPIENMNIQPYAVTQFSRLKENIDNQTYRFFLSELNTGISLNSNSNDANFSIAPYYLWKIWEQGFGGEVNLETEGVGINARGEVTFSTYDFCPDKYNLSV